MTRSPTRPINTPWYCSGPVHAVHGPATVDVILRPRADYDTSPLTHLEHAGGTWDFRCGELYGRWTSGPGARGRGEEVRMRLQLRAGERHDFVLELSDQALPSDLPDPGAAWRATEATWSDRVPTLEHTLAPRDTAHSLAVLHGLTSVSGGMVAAATTGLPERSGTGRNYDYRYVAARSVLCRAGRARGR